MGYMSSDIYIRKASISDAEELLTIYTDYVLNSAVTFEYDVPTKEEFENRIEHTLEKYPYLVAVQEDKILGYAYASQFHTRAAYQWNAETSIYVKKKQRQTGIGRMLYTHLEQALKAQGVLNLNACIAYTECEDEHLTNASVKFHEKMGYSIAGRFHQCGYKFDQWYDMVWMEKHIGEHLKHPKPVVPFAK